MDIAFDTTWCPVCNRQILPKRTYVPIVPQPAPVAAPAPPPSSPSSDPKNLDAAPQARLPRNKTGTIRARGGGLVHGTGRVKPNGALKRSEPTPAKRSPPPTAAEPAPTKPAGPVRHRTIIDQGPVPLYCSDECRLADLQYSHGAIAIDYAPERCTSPPQLPAPQSSTSDFSGPDESDDSGSFESRSSLVSSLPPSTTATSMSSSGYVNKGYAALARLYNLPPPPPPPPLLRTESSSSDTSPMEYQSGVMMAARRIKAALCPEQPKRSSWSQPPPAQDTPRKPIPGWTDGSHAWRASVYSFAAPSEVSGSREDDNLAPAYKSFVASTHRSKGVYSTLSESTPTAYDSSASVTSLPATGPPTGVRSRSEAEEMYSKYALSFSRRSESRASLPSTSPTGSSRSLPNAPIRHREVPLVKRGAEGRLLVPAGQMRRVPSALSSEGPSSWSSSAHSAYTTGNRKRSPLSRQNSDASMESADTASQDDDDASHWSASVSGTQKRAPQMRSWSYADTMTYPIMQLPPKKEKRIERRIVDGEERDVEVEVEIVKPLKRLFLFPDKEVRD
ncbi:hypothetical protein B0H21DRAFT_70272 [Amylocystis lapponica]|nr:hypothetical protein B0H21DRAFT_70272 [Amylocystis lapponica]